MAAIIAGELVRTTESHYQEAASLFQQIASSTNGSSTPLEAIAVLNDALQISTEAAAIRDQAKAYNIKLHGPYGVEMEAYRRWTAARDTCLGKLPVASTVTSAAIGLEGTKAAEPLHAIEDHPFEFDDDFKAIHSRLMASIDRANRARAARR